MMNKIIGKIELSKEQADAINRYLENNNQDIADLLDTHADKSESWGTVYKSLNGLSQSDMARALFVGYEVDEKFEIGDWVIRKDGGRPFIVTSSRGAEDLNDIRHATPEEIKAEQESRIWSKFGREPGEFRDGDGYQRGAFLFRTSAGEDFSALKELYEDGEISGFYPAESFIEFGGGE